MDNQAAAADLAFARQFVAAQGECTVRRGKFDARLPFGRG
jgi:hypothetical protein